MLTYAYGDIHGRADLLDRSFSVILRHCRGRRFQVVFLGDYIDRGPETRATLKLISKVRNEGRVIFLMGNHEEMLLKFLRTRSEHDRTTWLEFGGDATLTSYGADPEDPNAVDVIPHEHVDWMRRRPVVYETWERVFVHAGIDPALTLPEQGSREFLWIRDRFLAASAEVFVERRHIVHGHTPVWRGKPDMHIPELLPHRSNLDTGAYETGLLTIGVFTDEQQAPVDLLSIGG